MTHTLHPEIEKAIKETVEAAYEIHQAEAGKPFRGILHGIIIDNLGKYLLPPSQHLKDEPTTITVNYDGVTKQEDISSMFPQSEDNELLPEPKLLGTDFSKEDDVGCEIYGYTKDGNTVITKVNYVTPYVEEELKQSTPKIEQTRRYKGTSDSEFIDVLWRKQSEIIDYINNKD